MAIMVMGLVFLGGSSAYLAYMKSQQKESKTYLAIAEDGSLTTMKKTSKWDY